MKNVKLMDVFLLSLFLIALLNFLNQNSVKQPFGLDGTTSKIIEFSKTSMSQTTSSFDNDVTLYANPYDQDQPTISVNPTNPLNLAAGSQDQSTSKPAGATLWTIAYRSLDGGATWSQSYVPRAGPIALFQRAGNPVVDFNGFRNTYYVGTAYMRGATYDVSVWVSKSLDGGLTYNTPVMVDEGHGYPAPLFELNDQPWIATDKRTIGTGAGNVYVTWTSFVDTNGDSSPDTYHILFSRSIDGGDTFSTPIQVSDSDNWANRFSQVAVGPNGEVCVSWINWNLPATRIFFDKSTNYGESFGTDIEVQSFNQIPNLQYVSRTPPSTSMAVDIGGGEYNGYIYIVYPMNPPSTPDSSDVMLVRSINTGDTWSTPLRLNDDATSNDQFFPAIAADPPGHIKVAWYDRRLDSSNRYIDVFLTSSSDGGSSFSANTRITDTSFDPAGAFIGDHLDIDASATQVHPIWTDRRNGNNDVYTEYAPQGHELSVSLETPTILEPGDSTQLSATVNNIGSSNETNVELQLLINGTLLDSVLISELLAGSSYTLEKLWIPTAEGIYNITAYVPPILDETLILNNATSKSVQVAVLPDTLIVADDDASHHIRGTSLQEFKTALIIADYWEWKESTMGHPSLQFLLKFKLVIWTSGDCWDWAVDPADAATLEAYFNQGGNILLEGEDIGYDHGSDSLMANVAHAAYEVDYTEALGLTVTDQTHPVTQGLPQSCIWLTAPPADDGVAPSHGGFQVVRYTSTSWTAVNLFDGIGTRNGSVVYYAFPIYSMAQPERDTLIINSVRWLLPLVGDADRDRDVDYSDLSIFSIAYGSDPSAPNWKRECDFNEDNKVEALDLFDLGKNYGKTI